MMQSHDGALARVRQMAEHCDGITEHDREALRHVLSLLDDVVSDLAYCWDCTEALVLKQAAQSVAEQRSGKDIDE